MLREVSGDILMTDAQVIAHGVAPGDHFDSGLALALRERWPSMYKDFRHYCKVASPHAGGIWSWGGPGGVRIVSLFTQEPAPTKNSHPGAATLHNVNVSLRELAKAVGEEGFTSIALPRLATGVGRLDWEDVRPLVRKHLEDVGIPIVVYTEFHAGQKADEGLATH